MSLVSSELSTTLTHQNGIIFCLTLFVFFILLLEFKQELFSTGAGETLVFNLLLHILQLCKIGILILFPCVIKDPVLVFLGLGC